MEYVCGFLFEATLRGVVLIEKQKPAWQAGKLNGVGGKIEEGETPLAAMQREFEEETGAVVPDWTLFRVERFIDGTVVHWFAAKATSAQWAAVHTVEKERVIKWRGTGTENTLMYNIRYLLPMARCLMTQPPERVPQP